MPLCTQRVMMLLALIFSTGVQAAPEPEKPAPLFPILVGHKWGLIDQAGGVVVEPRFDELQPAHVVMGLEAAALMSFRPTRETLIGVLVDKKWTFVDRAGVLSTARFDDVGAFMDNDLAPAKRGRKWGFVDRAGHFVIEPRFTYAREFACGVAEVMQGSRWGLVDTAGRFVVRPVYAKLEDPCYWEREFNAAPGSMDRELIGVVVGRKMGYINRKGETVIAPAFVEQTWMPFHEGLKRVRSEPNGKDGYIDATGRYVIAPQFDRADDFVHGHARVVIGTRTAYIDRTGAFVDVPPADLFAELRARFPAFEVVRPFVDGRAAVCRGGLWGFIDEDGRPIIELQFDQVTNFQDGLALAAVGTEARYLDRSGKAVYTSEVPGLSRGTRRPCGNVTMIR